MGGHHDDYGGGDNDDAGDLNGIDSPSCFDGGAAARGKLAPSLNLRRPLFHSLGGNETDPPD